MSKQIQWFPGHMSKTLREFKDIKADLYFLLLDSRAPESTFIDSFKEIIKDKKVIILLTKADLVEQKELEAWVSKYKELYLDAFSISLNNKKEVRRKIIDILKKQKFKALLPKLVILGSPNVGKSTLLNILTDGRRAKAENRPGVTKNNSWYQFEKRYWVLDTPGVLQPKFIDEKQGINLCAIGSIKLDILPLEEVAIGLITRLKEIGALEIDNEEEYLNKLVVDSKKQPTEVYKNIIRDFQNNKFGKLILD